MSPRRKQPDDDEALLEELRERFDYATAEWDPIRDEGRQDMRAIAGDPWETEERKQREEANRPCLSLDELSQYVNQLINDVRQNKRAIKVDPEGNGADEATAALRANLIRQIEYRSHAQNAYTTSFENCVQRSYGFHRIVARYVPGKSFDQELFIEPLPNPDLVTPDPDALRADGSDMTYCFVAETRSKAEFGREFPHARLTDFGSIHDTAPAWVKDNRIQIAEYWTIETKTRRLLQLQAPGGEPLIVYEDELNGIKPSKALILQERDVDEPAVMQYLTNGVEILKRTKWPGKYIPIVCCLGKVLYVDSGLGATRQVLSLIRLARDPYMLYCYYRTCEAELVGMTPKTPYMAYEGQFSPAQLIEVQKSLHEPVAALFAKPTTEGLVNTLLPLPSRPSYEPPIQALEVGAESARRAIQAAIGQSPLPTSAQRQNEKSGIALQTMETSAQRGSYHFIDHYDDAIVQTGRILDDLIPHYYDTARDIGIRKPDDSAEIVRINDSNNPKSVPTNVGDHEVTISTGPSMVSEREAAKQFALALAGNPTLMPVIGDLVTKLSISGPVADELVERLTPPQFKKKKEGEGPDPAAMAQQLQQVQAQLQALGAQAQQMDQELKAKSAEIASKEKIALAEIASKEKIAAAELVAKERLEFGLLEKRNAAAIAAAHLAAATKGLALDAHAVEEQQALGFDADQADADRQHAAGMAERGLAQQLKAAQAGHAQALEAGQQGQAQALELEAQAAALPPPAGPVMGSADPAAAAPPDAGMVG